MKARRLPVLVLPLLAGCSVEVAALRIAATQPPTAEVLRGASSRGRQVGESCRFWLLALHGLPRIDEAMDNAMRPVGGAFMRDVTVYSEHPVYVLFGWHCYRVVGEVFG